ncbi:MAG: PEP-CTERM sorting domain-containing protein [Planctomycetota bacterium]
MRRMLTAAIVTLLMGFGPATALSKTILWDTRYSSTGYNYLDDYSEVANYLPGQGGYTSYDSSVVGFDNLESYDVLVVSVLASDAATYSTADITGISDFVQNGGGLLIMSTSSQAFYGYDNPNVNIEPVASAFGVALAVTDPTPSFSTADFAAHPLFNGISSGLYFGEAGEISSGSEVAWVEGTNQNQGLIVAADFGLGRFVTIGGDLMTNFNWQSPDCQDFLANNKFLSVNTFNYLTDTAAPSVPEPATIALLGLGGFFLIRVRKR